MENRICAQIEGIVFIAGDDGVPLQRLCDALEMKADEMQEYLDYMVSNYLEDDTRGIELVNYGGSYKFVSKASVHTVAQKLFENIQGKSFSQAALETLAIIAYKQPITRVEIEEIRGVGCDMMIRKLLARSLIKEVGRTDSPGKPFLYAVTESFMDTFKLQSLEELPALPEFEQQEDTEQLFG